MSTTLQDYIKLGFLLVLSIMTCGAAFSDTPLKLQIAVWEEEAKGSLVRVPHDLDGDGKTDIELIYTIREKFFVRVDPKELVRLYPGMILLTVPFPEGTMIYVIGRHPLYYWYDTNQDGKCDFVLHDPTESGFQYESTR